jgi:hypothetical protein
MPDSTLSGHCCCGEVRYRVDASPAKETICHCDTCRRASGAPLVAWFTVPTSRFQVVAGTIAHFRSSEHAERGFCPRCGTPLTFKSNHYPDEIDITTCSLDQPERIPPRDHTFTRSQLPWVTLVDELPRYEAARD